MTTESQNKRILSHLQKGRSLTQMSALQLFSCWRLASRVNFLRNQGHVIHTKMMKRNDGRDYASYFMNVPVEESGQTRIN